MTVKSYLEPSPSVTDAAENNNFRLSPGVTYPASAYGSDAVKPPGDARIHADCIIGVSSTHICKKQIGNK